MNSEVTTRRKAVKPLDDLETRAPLEFVADVEEKPDPVPVIVPERSELGTIPKPYTYADACAVVERIGLPAWQRLGYHGKKSELKTRG